MLLLVHIFDFTKEFRAIFVIHVPYFYPVSLQQLIRIFIANILKLDYSNHIVAKK
jgi:hypothetical protein